MELLMGRQQYLVELLCIEPEQKLHSKSGRKEGRKEGFERLVAQDNRILKKEVGTILSMLAKIALGTWRGSE